MKMPKFVQDSLKLESEGSARYASVVELDSRKYTLTTLWTRERGVTRNCVTWLQPGYCDFPMTIIETHGFLFSHEGASEAHLRIVNDTLEGKYNPQIEAFARRE